ncbi:MAG: hypothetical protein J6K97_01700 [Clostridia bacterium]|nr:hypothetical protein [Clostridia bacterium]
MERNQKQLSPKGGKAMFILGCIVLVLGLGLFIVGPSIISPFEGGTIFIFLGMALFFAGGVLMGFGSMKMAAKLNKKIQNSEAEAGHTTISNSQDENAAEANLELKTCPCCGARKQKSSEKCKYCGN